MLEYADFTSIIRLGSQNVPEKVVASPIRARKSKDLNPFQI
jgi:hypothetical protein